MHSSTVLGKALFAGQNANALPIIFGEEREAGKGGGRGAEWERKEKLQSLFGKNCMGGNSVLLPISVLLCSPPPPSPLAALPVESESESFSWAQRNGEEEEEKEEEKIGSDVDATAEAGGDDDDARRDLPLASVLVGGWAVCLTPPQAPGTNSLFPISLFPSAMVSK